MTGRLGRYAAWQARDFTFERGMPMLIVSALLLFPIIMSLRLMQREAPAMNVAELATTALVQSLPLLGFVLVFLAFNGIISNDRKRGYYRFLFAKPISLTGYYVQSFAIATLGAVSVAAVVMLTFRFAMQTPLLWGTVAFVALYVIGLGGVIFFFSSLFRMEWVLVAGLWLVSNMLRTLYPAGDSWYGQLFHVVLPPTHLVSDAAQSLVRSVSMPVGEALWLAGYGAAAFVLGLVLLARRPLGR